MVTLVIEIGFKWSTCAVLSAASQPPRIIDLTVSLPWLYIVLLAGKHAATPLATSCENETYELVILGSNVKVCLDSDRVITYAGISMNSTTSTRNPTTAAIFSPEMGLHSDLICLNESLDADTRDGSFSVSESEFTTSVGSQQPLTSIDYWLGTKYFDHLLAQCLASSEVDHNDQTSPQVSGPSLITSSVGETDHTQAKFNQLMRAYQYGDNLRVLHDKVPREQVNYSEKSSTDECESLMILIGWISRKGSGEERQTLEKSVQKFGGEAMLGHVSHLQNGERSPSSSSSSSSSSSATVQPALETLRIEVPQVKDLARYSSALSEYATKTGIELRYAYSESPVSPKFISCVSFSGLEFVGKSTSKKLAKHQANKAACQALKLVP
ncbi:hypothetical protein K431DRAFT_295895 [Polychaeton citri CBS 116435]|uniref:DRBM domain-containing protein n=1 Tax=Polychaeton citri CBS 116435 TaxID=1314669 RepID=A0A9P4UMH1_9PEZI|nr:hypothetical protein K431DRAFT_295895 [Polychaeton citri CBS 116435]